MPFVISLHKLKSLSVYDPCFTKISHNLNMPSFIQKMKKELSIQASLNLRNLFELLNLF